MLSKHHLQFLSFKNKTSSFDYKKNHFIKQKLFKLSVIVWESVAGAKSCGQPIWLKLGTEVGCNEIFQKPLWLTSQLTFSFGVTGGGDLFGFWDKKNYSKNDLLYRVCTEAIYKARKLKYFRLNVLYF